MCECVYICIYKICVMVWSYLHCDYQLPILFLLQLFSLTLFLLLSYCFSQQFALVQSVLWSQSVLREYPIIIYGFCSILKPMLPLYDFHWYTVCPVYKQVSFRSHFCILYQQTRMRLQTLLVFVNAPFVTRIPSAHCPLLRRELQIHCIIWHKIRHSNQYTGMLRLQ